MRRPPAPLLVALALAGLVVGYQAAERALDAVTPAPPVEEIRREHRVSLVAGGVAMPLVEGEPVAIAPGVVGTFHVGTALCADALTVDLRDAAGRPVLGATVVATAVMREMEHSRVDLVGEADGVGSYVIVLAPSMIGEWVTDVSVRTPLGSGIVHLVDDYR